MKSKVLTPSQCWIVFLLFSMLQCLNSEEVSYRLNGLNGSCSSIKVTIERNHTIDDEEIEFNQNDVKKVNRDYLRQTSILFNYLALIGPTKEQALVNSRCYTDMEALLDGIMEKQVWAMKVLDSSATITSGFILGNNHWIGSQKGCESAQQPLSLAMSDRYHRIMLPNLIQSVAPFDLEYRLVYARHHSKWQIDFKVLAEHILHIGMCMPSSCTNVEIFNMTTNFFELKARNTILNEYDLKAEVLEVKDFKLRDGFFCKKTMIMVGIVLLITVVMCLLASVNLMTDDIVQTIGLQNSNNNNNNIQTQPDQLVHSTLNGQTKPCKTTTTTPFSRNYVVKIESDLFEKVVQCFSISKNIKWIYDTTPTTNAIPIINGMKTIACFFILAFHVHWFMFFAVHNPYVLLHYAEQMTYQLIANAPLLVDLFFVVSAFLLTLSFLNNHRQMMEIKANGLMKNCKLFGKLLLQRYIRLTPTYAFIGLLGELFTSYVVDTSKFWVHERSDLNCQRYWWRNLMYIQNFFHHEELCMCWSWSMACEMQYYIIFSIILFIYAKNNKIGENVFKYFALAIFLASTTLILKIDPLPTFDILYQTGQYLYLHPIVRMAPYFPGVYAAWYYTMNKGTLPFSKTVSQYIWMLCGMVFLLVLNCTIERQMPRWMGNFLFIFVRYTCGLMCSWPIIASASGHGNWVSDVLSSRVFAHTNKLTYTIYLLNPLIITVIYGMSETSTHSDPVIGFVMTIGVTIISYVLAVMFSTMFEIPYCKLCTLLLKQRPRKAKTEAIE